MANNRKKAIKRSFLCEIHAIGNAIQGTKDHTPTRSNATENVRKLLIIEIASKQFTKCRLKLTM